MRDGSQRGTGTRARSHGSPLSPVRAADLSYPSAAKFLYRHFFAEDDLPDLNPAALEPSPKVAQKRGYTPTREEVKRLLGAPGTPKARLLAKWLFYAPSRRQTYSDARWSDVDLEQGTWEVIGKGDQPDVFALAPALLRELRQYRRWQLSQAERCRRFVTL